MLSAVLAFVGAFVYGSSDFLGGLAAKSLRSIVATAVAGASGLIGLVLGFLVLSLTRPELAGQWRIADELWGALSGLIGIVAIVLLYACLALGPMSILSPLAAVVSAISPMLWGLIVRHETLGPLGYVGLGIALVAVVLVGFIPGEKVVRPSLRGLLMAVGSGIAIGAFVVVIDQTSSESGITPLIVNRATNGLVTGLVVLVILVTAIRRGRPAASALAAQGAIIGATPSGRADLEHATESRAVVTQRTIPASAWWLAIACGVVDATANVMMLVALRGGDLSVVAALTALYPAGTIVLAAIVLHERIAPVQWLGLVLAIGAGALLAAA
jgi:drug/metabolite transporter (DMT)-like permease